MRFAADVVLFDAVGTLFYADPPVAEVYETVGRRCGSQLTKAEIVPRFRAAFAAQEAIDRNDLQYRTDEAREHRRWRKIVAESLCDVSDSQAAFDELWNHFARPEAWRLFDDAAATVVGLLDRGRTLGVASNFDARLAPIVAFHLPQITPKYVFSSARIGYRKPGSEFFASCATVLSPFTTKQILLVGDDPHLDVAGALQFGWQAVLIDRKSTRGDRMSQINCLDLLLG